MLQDKTVFLSGAGSGIGKATAKKLLELGARVFSLESSAANIAATREELPDGRLRFFEGDVRGVVLGKDVPAEAVAGTAPSQE